MKPPERLGMPQKLSEGKSMEEEGGSCGAIPDRKKPLETSTWDLIMKSRVPCSPLSVLSNKLSLLSRTTGSHSR